MNNRDHTSYVTEFKNINDIFVSVSNKYRILVLSLLIVPEIAVKLDAKRIKRP